MFRFSDFFKRKPVAEIPPAEPSAPPAPKVVRTRADVTHFAYDNEHPEGVKCTLTFADGHTASGITSGTGYLASDQAVATSLALCAVNM